MGFLLMALLVAGIVTPATDAAAQGMFLDKGTSGFGFGAGYQTNEDVSGYSLTAGGSAKGTLDLGMSIGRLSFDQHQYMDDLKATAISPFLRVHAIKQSESIPFSFSFGASYEWDSYSSDMLEKTEVEMKGSAYSFGGSLYSTIPMSFSVELVPTVGITYTEAKVEFEDSFGESISADGDVTTYSFGLNLSLRLPENRKFILGPGAAVNDENTTFTFSIGFVFPTNPSGLGI
jgi:hypothetical protein